MMKKETKRKTKDKKVNDRQKKKKTGWMNKRINEWKRKYKLNEN